MNAKITYLLTEQAQRDAMATTGVPVARQQMIEAEIPTGDLDLCSIAADGTPSLDMTVSSHRHLNVLEPGCWSSSPYQWGAVQTYESLIGALRAAYSARAAAQAAKAYAAQAAVTAEAEYDSALATALDALQDTAEADRVQHTPTRDPVHPRSLSVPSHQPLARTALDAYCARWADQRAAEAAAAKAAEAAKEQAKLSAISAWVGTHGNYLTRARHADGLLHRAEAVRLMAEWVMDSYSVPDEDDRQICDERKCPCSESEITTLSEAAYEAWVAVREELPEDHTVTFWRVRECPTADEYGDRDEDACGHHTAAYISIPYGPFRFTRQIRLAEGVL
jgi:hypothetical protein